MNPWVLFIAAFILTCTLLELLAKRDERLAMWLAVPGGMALSAAFIICLDRSIYGW